MSTKQIIFTICFCFGLYFLLTGSLIIGLILICLAVIIPAA